MISPSPYPHYYADQNETRLWKFIGPEHMILVRDQVSITQHFIAVQEMSVNRAVELLIANDNIELTAAQFESKVLIIQAKQEEVLFKKAS
jgi:hypothetical protein